MKKITLLLCFVICLLGLQACAPEKPVDESTASILQNMSASIIEGAFAPLDAAQTKQLTDMGPEYIEFVFENAMGMQVEGNGMVSGFNSWTRGMEEIGPYKEITGYDVRYNSKGTGFIVNASISGEKGTGVVELTIKDDLNHTVESAALNVDYTFGQKMQRAGLNTLLGMGTVFVVLIIIMLVIYCFNFIPKIQEIFAKETPEEIIASVPVSGPAVTEEVTEDETDDDELIAVISAAIAAYESESVSVSPDGYVVRSIRRR
ncbi:MAG: OadG family protein [Lachnospiraceae bacterium]|nr:OadG family protein [Lachnospiraceae bacterium]